MDENSRQQAINLTDLINNRKGESRTFSYTDIFYFKSDKEKVIINFKYHTEQLATGKRDMQKYGFSFDKESLKLKEEVI